MIEEVSQCQLRLTELPCRQDSLSILLAEPSHFDVEYVINPHMAGLVGTVDKQRALQQWHSLRAAYQSLGCAVSVLPAEEGFPDLVFIANQSFPAVDASGKHVAVLSRMYAEQRRGEVPIVERFFVDRGIPVHALSGHGFFEGTGDANWFPGRRLIVAGHGFRSSRAALSALEAFLDVPLVALELTDPRFYHLDTCLSLINEETALYVPGAFSERSEALLKHLIPNLVPLPLDESVEGLACNGHCPDGTHYIVHGSNKQTMRLVEAQGLIPLPVDTSEFLKSGGSVFCMKLVLSSVPTA